MDIKRITSAQNEYIKRIAKLKEKLYLCKEISTNNLNNKQNGLRN